MSNKLYIGGLSFSTVPDALEDLFGQVGSVVSVAIIKDRETGRSKGFGFVEMGTNDEAEAAIQKLKGTELDGRALRVSLARPQEQKPRRF